MSQSIYYTSTRYFRPLFAECISLFFATYKTVLSNKYIFAFAFVASFFVVFFPEIFIEIFCYLFFRYMYTF